MARKSTQNDEEIDLVSTRFGGGPEDSEFYRRVLWFAPTPLCVTDALGSVVFMNEAMEELTGYSAAQVVGDNMMNYLHPDDTAWVIDTFVGLAESPDSGQFNSRNPWASVIFRIVGHDGSPIPVEVTGSAGLNDSAVAGVIYEMRPADGQDLVARVLNGIASGDPIADLLSTVLQLVATRPLEMDAAVLETRGDEFRVVASTSDELAEVFGEAPPSVPWNLAFSEPQFIAVADLPAPLDHRMTMLGYADFWHAGVESSQASISYRIVACTPVHQVPAMGAVNRVARATELAAAVLYRAHTDQVLERAATHDGLTELRNRAGFTEQIEGIEPEPGEIVAMLFIDLDDFKQVNDSYGHAAGDAVLKAVAARLTAVTRAHDVVARLGGDEFAVLLRSSPDRPLDHELLRQLADRILAEIGQPIDVGLGRSASVKASVGVAVSDECTDIERLHLQADNAMYAAKRAGGDRPHFISIEA